MAKKKLVLVIRNDPFSWKVFDALRVAVASSMNHDVYVIFMKNGVYALSDWKPKLIGIEPYEKSIETLGMFGASIIVEEEGLRERGIKLKDWKANLKTMSKDDICEIINSAEVILSW